ncbi:hypothetical protein D3C76_1398830 [compost metagenome]
MSLDQVEDALHTDDNAVDDDRTVLRTLADHPRQQASGLLMATGRDHAVGQRRGEHAVLQDILR